MKYKKLIAVGVVMILGITFFLYRKFNTSKEIHYHAGFVVFENGKKVDFSDSKYMYIRPCSVNQNKKPTASELQLEKAHLHDGIGDVVHVEATGAKWSDLFTNIGFPVDYASASGFINGNLVSDFQNTPIHPYDSLVLFIGLVDKNLLSQAVTKNRILQVEKTSVECGK